MKIRTILAVLIALFAILTLFDRFVLVELLIRRTGLPLLLAIAEAMAIVATGALVRRAKRVDPVLDFLLGYPLFGTLLFLVGTIRVSALTLVPLLVIGVAACVFLLLKWYGGAVEDKRSATEDGQAGLPVLHWPEWLHIDNPLTMRRATFRDVPLLRMTNLVARATGAPFELPETRIEVLLVDGGAYDPLTDVVTLRIAAADLVERDQTLRVAPFTLTRSRSDIRLLGATGEPIRYPGVICSREGQELVVGSHAPVMVTA
jgi:hypothetical protein